MKIAILSATAVLAASAFAQTRAVTDPGAGPSPASGNAPIYHVTVVERTIKAVNYFYRQGPTQIDFRGTVLLPKGKGGATVESRQGRTEIDASFEHFQAIPAIWPRISDLRAVGHHAGRPSAQSRRDRAGSFQ